MGRPLKVKKNSLNLSSTETISAGNECRKIQRFLDRPCTYKGEVHPSLADCLPPQHQPYITTLLALRDLNDMANKVRMNQIHLAAVK